MWKFYFDHHRIDVNKLQKAAERAGQSIESYVADAVRQRLNDEQSSSTRQGHDDRNNDRRSHERPPESKL